MTLLVDCDTLERWYAGPLSDPTRWGTVERDTVNFVQGTASVKFIVKAGVWAAFLNYARPFGDWMNLSAEPIISFPLLPSEVNDRREVELRIATAEPDGTGYVEYNYGLISNLIPLAWNTVEVDLRADVEGKYPDLSMVRGFSLVYYIYEDPVSPTLNVDAIESFPGAPMPLSVTVSPEAATVFEGDFQTFEAKAIGGEPPYTLQWYEGTPPNGTPLLGETGTALYVSADMVGTFGYYVEARDNVGNSATSPVALLTILERPAPPAPAKPLHIQGRDIKDSTGKTVILRGIIAGNFGFVDVPSGQFVPVGETYAFGSRGWKPNTVQTHLNQLRDFGANCARVTMNYYDWAANTLMPIDQDEGGGSIRFRDALTQLLLWARERGIYLVFTGFCVLPANSFIDGVYTSMGGGRQDLLAWPPWQDASAQAAGPVRSDEVVPDLASFVQFWVDFVMYYHARGTADNLLIDPHNEANPRGDAVAMTEYQQAFQQIIDVLRGQGIENILCYQMGYGIDGSNWGYVGQSRFFDFIDAYPVTDPSGNVLYTAHAYGQDIMRQEPGWPPPPDPGPKDYDSVRRRMTNYSDWVNPETGLPEPHPEWGHHIEEYLSRGYPIAIFETAPTSASPGSDDPDYQERWINFASLLDDWGLSFLGWWWSSYSTGPLWDAPFSVPPRFTDWGRLLREYMIPAPPTPPTFPLWLLAIPVGIVLLSEWGKK